MFKSVPDWKNNLDTRQLEEAGLSLPHPIKGRVAPVDMHKQYTAKRKPEVGRSLAESKNMEGPSKKAKTCPSQERRMVVRHATSDFVKRENMDLALKEEDPEEEDPEEETKEERRLREASISSVRVEEVKQVSKEVDIDVPVDGGRFPSFPPNSQGSSSIGLSSREVLNRLQEIMLVVQRSEELERQVNESRQKNAELEREKVELASQVSKLRRIEMQLKDNIDKKHNEFQSQKWRMEQDKKGTEKELIEIRSKLERATQKAKELIEIVTIQDPTLKMK